MTFHVGQKVVCVDASPAFDGGACGLKKNATYVVSEIATNPDCEGDVGISVYGAKPRNISFRGIVSSGFFISTRFRPVVEKKTDISIFTEILDRASGKQREKVSDHQS